LTIVVADPLLTDGGTVVLLVTRVSQAVFDDRHGTASTGSGGDTALEATARGIVTFVEFEAPPNFEYRFRTRSGGPVATRQVSVGEGGGYINAATGNSVTSDVTFHHHIAGARADEATSRALLGSFFRIDPATCRVGRAVRVCSGGAGDFDEMHRWFERSETP